MGNTNQLIATHLKFIQNIQDSRFGDIDIYQNDEGRFLMKTVKTHILGDRRHNEFKRILEWVQQQPTKMVVPIINTNAKHQKNLCVQYEITTLYLEYYNYTLKDLIHSQKGLEEAELWFVLAELLGLVIQLKKHKIGINLEIDNVFLTLKGHPTVYPHHLLSFQDTICVSNYGMGQQIAKMILQLANLQMLQSRQEDQEKEMLCALSKLCSKYKLMGRIVRELLYRQRPQSQILDQILAMVQNKAIRKANEVKLIKFKYMIPEKKEEKTLKNDLKDIVEHPIGKTNPGKKKMQMQTIQMPSHTDLLPQKQDIINAIEKKGLNKQAVDRMLADISQKKKLNIQKMHRFQQKKDQLILNSVRNKELAHSAFRKSDGKENAALGKNNMRKSEKKGKGDKDRERRATEGLPQHNHIR